MSHQQRTAEWDGKSAEGIKAIFAKYHREDDFADNLITMLEFPAAQKGASWQLKAWLEDGASLSDEQLEQFYAHMPNFKNWETQLHYLQSLPYLSIPESQKEPVRTFLDQCLASKNKFVRAWTYNGYHLLAQQHSEFTEKVDVMLINALESEAPSVKARIRNIKK